MKTYLVQAAGVSLICPEGPIMIDWIRYIVSRGDLPQITLYQEAIQ